MIFGQPESAAGGVRQETERTLWVIDFAARFQAPAVAVLIRGQLARASQYQLSVPPEAWGRVAEEATRLGLRWCGLWAEDRDERIELTVVLEHDGVYLLVRTRTTAATPSVASHAPYYPASDRCERRLTDLFGIPFRDPVDSRRWIRHQAWSGLESPLRKAYPLAGSNADPVQPDSGYPFLEAQGPGVYEIPVGPVHAGIIEPGHFRFQAVGESILHLEARLGYVHKGIEKVAEGRDPVGLARLAGRVSGDATVAHTWAACMAMEQAAGLALPVRALALRAILAERERISNHLGDIGAICGDVGFAFGQYQFGRLRERCLRLHAELFGHRLLMDRVVPGGVSSDLPAEGTRRLLDDGIELRKELKELNAILDENPSLQDRWCTTGILPTETARKLGVLGYTARASGIDFDLRRDAPYAPYDALKVRVPVSAAGDVAARVRVRQEEIDVALGLIDELVSVLPGGPFQVAYPAPVPGAEGLGCVEGWRGEHLAYVRFGPDSTIARYYPRDPSVLNWPALEQLIIGNIVPDFPVCNKSLNGSYSGHDL